MSNEQCPKYRLVDCTNSQHGTFNGIMMGFYYLNCPLDGNWLAPGVGLHRDGRIIVTQYGNPYEPGRC